MSKKEYVTVSVRIPDEEADWINRVAKFACVKPDVAASVIFAMSVVRNKQISEQLSSARDGTQTELL